MKKFKLLTLSLFFISVLVSPVTLSAQRYEIFGGFSTGGEIGKVPDMPKLYHTKVCTWLRSIEEDKTRTAMTLGLRMNIIAGLSAEFSWTGLNSYSQTLGMDNYSVASMNCTTNTFLFGAKYKWLSLRKFNFYTSASAGFVCYSLSNEFYNPDIFHTYDQIITQKEDNFPSREFAYQLNYLGIEYRPIKTLGFFIEGGYGRRGVFTAGIVLIP
ncbi:MAG: hypothetical protein NC207_08490 [Bacteroides sp.]|nr:hypothetical protein [Bacteroides sp.]